MDTPISSLDAPYYAPYPGNWKKTMAVIFAGQAFSLLSSSAAGFAVIWYLTSTTGSATVLSLATIAAILPQGLISPYAGTVVDRYNRKTIMIAADITIAASAGIIAMLFMVLDDVPLAAVFILLVIRSVATAFQQPAFQAATPHIVPQDQLVRIGSIQMALASFANIGGPALGIFIYEMFGMQFALFSDVIGAACAISALLVVFIPNVHGVSAERMGTLHEMKEGWQELRRHRGIFALTMAITLGTLFYFPVAALNPLMTTQHFGGGGFEASLIEGLWGVGMLIGSIVLGIWGGGKRLSLLICGSMLVIGIACFAAGLLPSGGFVWFVVLNVVMALVTPFFGGPYTALLQMTVEPAKLGRVISLSMFFMIIASPIGLLIAGPISDRIGVPIWYAICGGLLGLVAVGAYLFPSVRKLESGVTRSGEEEIG
ncbi:MAG: MFS transporter [Actinobacteria bacterium]|nr:MFS transporter [Actinomycetota bacterium]